MEITTVRRTELFTKHIRRSRLYQEAIQLNIYLLMDYVTTLPVAVIIFNTKYITKTLQIKTTAQYQSLMWGFYILTSWKLIFAVWNILI